MEGLNLYVKIDDNLARLISSVERFDDKTEVKFGLKKWAKIRFGKGFLVKSKTPL